MASLEERNGSYRITFVWKGKREKFTLGRITQDKAESKAAAVGHLLMRLKEQFNLPPGMNIVDFIRYDGNPPATEEPEATTVTLAGLRDQYLDATARSLEANTLDGIRLHFKHLTNHFGEQFAVAGLSMADLQKYINARSKAKGIHGRTLSPATLKKEIISLRTAWNWAVPMELVTGRFPAKGLRYPKGSEKPHFQTREEIERRIAGGGLAKAEIADLWDAMYLTVDEINELLDHVKANAIQPFVYPLFCFLAHTGTRRSEAIRAKVTDIDFKARIVTINERKRVRGASSTRRVPLSPFLIGALKDWLGIHPGGSHLFCQQAVVGHSKKRSLTTGHKIQGARPTSGKARAALVKPREDHAVSPLTRNEFRDHFKRTLSEGKWKDLKGPHALRHSFISACASKGIDQRLVESWAGHMSPEISRRYAHLWPSVQQEALARVFG